MSVMEWGICCYALIYLGIMFFALISFLWLGKPEKVPTENFPSITILVAARNESASIASCINAIKKVEYPREKIHIYIGNDGSDDNTREVAEEAISGDPRFVIEDIPQLAQAGGKARVLEILARNVRTEYIYILDADTLPGKGVLKCLVSKMKADTAVVSGTTVIGDGGCQDLDWRFYALVLQGFANVGIPGTAVGNNMLIKSSALSDIGGFEAVPFSVTEDYALFKTFVHKGWGWANVFESRSLNYTRPAPDAMTLLQQRKRWSRGGLDFPWYWVSVFFLFGMYPLILLVAMVFAPIPGMLLFTSRFLVHALIQFTIASTHRLKTGILDLVVYEIYLPIQLGAQMVSMLFPTVVWKDRKY